MPGILNYRQRKPPGASWILVGEDVRLEGMNSFWPAEIIEGKGIIGKVIEGFRMLGQRRLSEGRLDTILSAYRIGLLQLLIAWSMRILRYAEGDRAR